MRARAKRLADGSGAPLSRALEETGNEKIHRALPAQESLAVNWSFLLVSFCLALMSGAIAVVTLARIRPGWSGRRLRILAALVLPAITLFATGAALLFVALSGSGEGADMKDLALRAIAVIGGAFAILAFVGGIIGASLLQRRMGR